MIQHPELIELGTAIADGAPIDWAAADRRLDPQSRAVARRLRLVERISQVHASLPEAASFSTSLRGPTAHPGEHATPAADTPATWGPLTIIERIGRGTFGDVYRARDPSLDRWVALKLLRRRESNAKVLESAVIHEGRLAARVRHPNVVTVYGAERIDGRVGLWMEFVDGRSLEDELRQRGPLPPQEVAAICVDLCRALTAVHAAGLVHRDVKAANVMRERGGRVVLTDFGAGRELHDKPGPGRELAGTPLYLAPEVLSGGPTSARSDVYSLGVLMYHLATGAFPVRGRSLEELREAHARRNLNPSAAARHRMPPALACIVEAAIRVDAAERYVAASELEAALTRFLRPPIWRSRRPWIAAALALAVIGVAGAGWTLRPAPITAKLSYHPRDPILITRFENRTGEPVFDGAIEYALERELSNSDTVGLVSRERVEDALRLMRRSADTVVDRNVGREVAIRDGRIKALMAGKIERFADTYILTAQLIDPADDVVVATLTEQTKGQHGVVAALGRQSAQVRIALGERRDRMTGGERAVEQATTRSLNAFRLYNESCQLGRQAQWPAAHELAKQVVAADPEFASGWAWLAWSTHNVMAGAKPALIDPQNLAKARQVYTPYLQRAKQLSDGVPEWERLWIAASADQLLGEHGRAIPMYEALLKLRPDHHYAANNLLNANIILDRKTEILRSWRRIADQRPNDLNSNATTALLTVEQTRDLAAAQPYVERMRQLLPSAAPSPVTTNQNFWLDLWLEWLPAYAAWDSGDVRATLERAERAAADLEQRPLEVRNLQRTHIGNFYLTLGRLREARTFLVDGRNGEELNWNAAFLADVRGEPAEMRQHIVLLRLPSPNPRPMMLIRAGMIDRAREIIRSRPVNSGFGQAFRDLAVGDLELRDRHPERAVPHLEAGMSRLSGTRFQEYYAGCESLASAFESLNKPADSTRVLESCSAHRPRYNGALTSPFFWMRLNLRLADTYRAAGRIADAQTLENDLRRLLVYADTDHPLVKRLNAR